MKGGACRSETTCCYRQKWVRGIRAKESKKNIHAKLLWAAQRSLERRLSRVSVETLWQGLPKEIDMLIVTEAREKSLPCIYNEPMLLEVRISPVNSTTADFWESVRMADPIAHVLDVHVRSAEQRTAVTLDYP